MAASGETRSYYQMNWSRAEAATQQVLSSKGIRVVSKNGQRVYGPPAGWERPEPQRGSEVFVGRLPRDLYEDELLPVLEVVGEVYLLRLLMDFSGTNRGYAFVRYASPTVAQAAVERLNRYEIRPGYYIGVRLSVDNRCLYLGNIPGNRNRQDLLQELQHLTEHVTKVTMHRHLPDRPRNYAFVEYETHQAAAMARRRLFSLDQTLWRSTKVVVDWARPLVDDLNKDKVSADFSQLRAPRLDPRSGKISY
nr:RNA-binding protein 47-like [Cherax quadricarinatus]